MGSIRGGAGGGGVFYAGGGGYGGDYYGGYVGAIYGELIDGEACPPAPFGYVVGGFGRSERRPSRCSIHYGGGHDRGGRYGYSERRGGCHDPCRGRWDRRSVRSGSSGLATCGCGGWCSPARSGSWASP